MSICDTCTQKDDTKRFPCTNKEPFWLIGNECSFYIKEEMLAEIRKNKSMYAKPMPPEIEAKFIELMGNPTDEQLKKIKAVQEKRRHKIATT